MQLSRSDPGCACAKRYHVNTRLTLRFARDGLGTSSVEMHGRAIRSSSIQKVRLAPSRFQSLPFYSIIYGLHLLFPKFCLLFYSALLQKLTVRFTFPNYSRRLPRLQAASLTSQWYLCFCGLGAFTIHVYSRLVLGVFFYHLRQLPIANSIPPFMSLNCYARLVPRPCFDWERVAGRKMLPIIPTLCSVLVHAQIMPEK